MTDSSPTRDLRAALVLLGALTGITGVAYPLAVTAIGVLAFPAEREGSLLRRHGAVVGSALVGQAFGGPRWFHGRPSATSVPYQGNPSVGSNLGPLHPDLIAAQRERAAILIAEDGGAVGVLPVDLLTASGSGLDPHVSPAAARLQAPRVARARALDPARVAALVEAHVEPRQFGVLGEPRVNVLRLNLALDSLSERSSGASR